MKTIKYLTYLLRHKYHVGLACFREGLYWRGLIHDLSKFLPSEWIPYLNWFYGDNPEWWSGTFNVAWLKHIHRNPHHWQHWILREDSGEVELLEMPDRYLIEMVCDWYGAGIAQNKTGGWDETWRWFQENRDRISLHWHTRELVEAFLQSKITS
jgi:hypothetical protein